MNDMKKMQSMLLTGAGALASTTALYAGSDQSVEAGKALVPSLEINEGYPSQQTSQHFLDLKKDGPTVIEVPPQLQGLIDDMWHRPIADIGAAGPDKGKGGKHLFLPPDYEGEVRTEAYFDKSWKLNDIEKVETP